MTPQAPPRAGWFSLWDLAPLGASLLLLVLLPWLLAGLPDPLPTHFTGAGKPNGWTPHGALPWIILGIPALLWLLLLLTGWAFAGSNQDPDGRKSAALAPLRGCMALGTQLLLLAPLAMARLGNAGLGLGVAAFLLLLGLGVALMIRDMKRSGVDPGNPEHCRWGLIYVNPDDPAIWVPKRMGLGWTLNFAHGRSWFMLGILLLPVFLVLVFALSR
jgi:uncharacterized membrane protein